MGASTGIFSVSSPTQMIQRDTDPVSPPGQHGSLEGVGAAIRGLSQSSEPFQLSRSGSGEGALGPLPLCVYDSPARNYPATCPAAGSPVSSQGSRSGC